MISLIFLASYIGSLFWIAKTRGAAPLIAALFLIFGFTLRAISIVYIDIFGPMFSTNLDTYVGGGGAAAPIFIASIMVLSAIIQFSFRESYFRKTHIERRIKTRGFFDNAMCYLVSGYVIWLYVDMLYRGVVPLFSGMERFTYTELYAGAAHKLLVDFTFMISAVIGYFFIQPRLEGKSVDIRYIGILAAIFVYFVLTGNRFSAFFTTMTYFGIPVSGLMILGRLGLLAKLPPDSQQRRLMSSVKVATPFLVIAAMATTIFTLYNSIYNVRGYADPLAAFEQRTMIQPTELWWATWDSSVRVGRDGDPIAWSLMFGEPLDPTRNTGIQYLMIKSLGFDRTGELIRQGEQFAGGYPEVFFELFGVKLVAIVIFVFALITVAMLRFAVVAAVRGKFFTFVFSIYVFYGFSLLYIGGMLNFLTVWTFWVKLVGLVVCNFVERPNSEMRANEGSALWV